MRYLIVCLALLMPACAPTPMMVKDGNTRSELQLDDPKLLTPCESFAVLPDNPTPVQVLQQHLLDSMAFKSCSIKQEKLANFIRKIFTIKEQ